jgi:endo-1,4-beta-D-glucanase Y
MRKIFTLTLAFCATLSASAQINSGSPAKPFNSTTGYANGIMPTNLPSGGAYGKSQDAANAYNSWKSRFVSTCSGKGSRVLYDDGSSTVSEGIGYGMLLSAYAGDKALFDALWQFYKASVDGNNLMNWKYSSCTGVSGGGSATDADLDAAMALIVAADQWPSATSPYTYKTEASNIIAKIRAVDVTANQFNNGDSWNNSDCRNPSYQAPAYARMFKTIETGQASFWDGVASGSSSLVISNRNATTGLVNNWCTSSGASNGCNGDNNYGFDANRNPWRMTVDVLWNGSATATAGADICGKLANWAKNYAANFSGPLPQNAANPSVGPNTGGSYSTFGLPFMAAGSTYQTSLNTAYTAIVTNGIYGNNDTYFNSSIRCLTLFTMTGNFWQPGSNILRATVAINTPSDNSSFKQGASVSFSATTTVSSGSIAKVEYYDGTTLLGSSTTSPYTFSTTTLAGGNHVITARAYQGSTVVAESGGINILITGASSISTTGIFDSFESSKQVSQLTGGTIGTSCSTANTAATAGVYWFSDTTAAPTRKFTFTQKGDGVLTYTLTNAAGAYNVIGFNFGQYCMGNKINNYYLDLSNNANLSFTVSAPATNTRHMQLKITMKDSAGSVLTFNSTIINATTKKPDTTNWYKYDIGFSKNHPTTDYPCIWRGHTYNFKFDFSKAFTTKDPTKSGATNINFNNTDFNFKKVKEVDMIPLDSVDSGAPSYNPVAYSNQVLIFSNLALGDITLGPDFCTTPAAPKVTSPVAYCSGSAAKALTATGLSGLNLQWYDVASGGTASSTAIVPSTGSAGSTIYYVSQKVGLSGTCEGPRTPITVNVTDGPTVNPGSDQTSVAGPSVSLSGSGTATGTWSVATAPAGATVSFSPSANAAAVTASGLSVTGLYTFTYTVPGTAPCISSAANVNVNVTSVVNALNDEFLTDNIQIYPNPVSDILYVNTSKIDGSKTVKLVDTYGKVVYETSGSENQVISMSHLNSGMYFVQIQAASGVMTKAVVKK